MSDARKLPQPFGNGVQQLPRLFLRVTFPQRIDRERVQITWFESEVRGNEGALNAQSDDAHHDNDCCATRHLQQDQRISRTEPPVSRQKPSRPCLKTRWKIDMCCLESRYNAEKNAGQHTDAQSQRAGE